MLSQGGISATRETKFAAGHYCQKSWISSDAIEYTSYYRVVKRSPKRVTVTELYPDKENGPYVYEIREDEIGEYFMPSPVIGSVRPLRLLESVGGENA